MTVGSLVATGLTKAFGDALAPGIVRHQQAGPPITIQRGATGRLARLVFGRQSVLK